MIRTDWQETCKCCNGIGTQMNIYSGQTEYCKACGGTGMVWRSNYDNLPPGTYCMSVGGQTHA